MTELAPGEWAALGLIAEGPVHGYDVARLLGPDGAIGAVWTVSRPLVYRAVQQLEAHGLVRPARSQASERGPNRTLLQITAKGRRALDAWLAEPVQHVRDVRSVLLLKLALLDRQGRSPKRLLGAQRAVVTDLLRALERRQPEVGGFEATLLAWRIESARAVVRFIDATR